MNQPHSLPSEPSDSLPESQRPDVDPREFSILIVDNDKAHARAMTESLERVGYRCAVATSGPEGIQQIERGNYHVVVSDLVMNDADGMQVLQRAKAVLPECEVIMVTGHATVPTAVEAMQEGAFNFLEKPITPNRLRAVTAKAIEAVQLRQTNIELRQRLDETFGFEGIIFASPKMKDVIERIRRIAPTDATVLVTGESGTGKEMIAQAIHQNSPRKNKRLKALNVRAVSEQLVESELFGHVKGAFTDAASDRVGAFEYTDGGTLFLDEVGDMPMSTQIKLLRVLEEHRITRVGDNKSIKVNVRLISATNRPLEALVQEGAFRNDLYYRLNIVTVHLPPLRERRDDIVPLMEHFRKFFLKRHGRSAAHFAPAVTRRFFDYPWPGNIRQLRNFVETMVVLDTDGNLDVNDLPPELSIPDDLVTSRPAESSSAAALMTGDNSSLLGQSLDTIERWAIEETLKLTNDNREEAATILKVGPRTLYRKLDKYRREDELRLAFQRIGQDPQQAMLIDLATVDLDKLTDKPYQDWFRGESENKKSHDKKREGPYELLGLMTTDKILTSDVAKRLLEHGQLPYECYAFESVGTPGERMFHGTLEQIAELSFTKAGQLILVRNAV